MFHQFVTFVQFVNNFLFFIFYLFIFLISYLYFRNILNYFLFCFFNLINIVILIFPFISFWNIILTECLISKWFYLNLQFMTFVFIYFVLIKHLIFWISFSLEISVSVNIYKRWLVQVLLVNVIWNVIFFCFIIFFHFNSMLKRIILEDIIYWRNIRIVVVN